MPNKRKSDDAYDETVPEPYASPLAPRRKVKAKAGGGMNSMLSINDDMSMGSGVNSITSGPGGTPTKSRKKDRKRLYLRDMMLLNDSFVKWAHQKESTFHESKKGRIGTVPCDNKKFIEQILSGIKSYDEKVDGISLQYDPRRYATLMFGGGDAGQLGLLEGVTESRYPRSVNSLNGQRVEHLSLGGLHSAVLLENGSVQVWGCNDEGSLGNYEVDTAYAPMGISGCIPSSHEVFKNEDEGVSFWKDLTPEQRTAVKNEPLIVPKEYEENMVDVALGDCQTLMLSSTGRVYFAGTYKCINGKSWRDAAPPDDPRVTHPKKGSEKKNSPYDSQDWPIHCYKIPGKAEKVDCGASFNAAIVTMSDPNGTNSTDSIRACVTWGIGEAGELARPVYNPIKEEVTGIDGEPSAIYHWEEVRDEHLVPKPVVWPDSLTNRRVEEIACGGYHLLVTASDSGEGVATYASGNNNYGQLGLGDKENRLTLAKITYLDGKNIAKLAAGNFHSLCLDKSKTNLYTMGRSDSGQLGITETLPDAGSYVTTPVPVKLVKGQENPCISKIACGDTHCIVSVEGSIPGASSEVYTWGFGSEYALGHGGSNDECMPRRLDVMAGINKKLKSKDPTAAPRKADIQLIAGGGQHSGIVIIGSSNV